MQIKDIGKLFNYSPVREEAFFPLFLVFLLLRLQQGAPMYQFPYRM